MNLQLYGIRREIIRGIISRRQTLMYAAGAELVGEIVWGTISRRLKVFVRVLEWWNGSEIIRGMISRCYVVSFVPRWRNW